MPTKTTAEIAAEYGVSKRTVHRMAEAGDLVPTYTMPGNRAALYDADAVAEAFTRRAERTHPAA